MESQFFKTWILDQHNDNYHIICEAENVIQLHTDYAIASITFTEIENTTILEFNIITHKDNAVKFYLHFELNDEQHAQQLFDEMVETLIHLKEEKTLKVLLSCSAGLTTSMFAEKLNSVAQMLNLDYQFDAVSYLSIYEEVENYDVILIAPQIGYMLKRLKDSLTNKLVLQIPTSVFASYDALSAIQFLQKELEIFNERKEEKEECICCCNHDKRILSIVISANKTQTKIYYRLYDQCQIIDSQMIIKSSMNIYDLYDIIDIVLLKHDYIDVIGIATPGIVKDNKKLKDSKDSKEIDIQNEFEHKYNIKVFVYNNANAAVVGFSLEHPEYKNIIYHSQPFGYGVGGQGIISNGYIVKGKNGIAGEIKYFLKRMQLSNDANQLALTEIGALELLTKSLLPSIAILGSEAIAINSPMTPHIHEIKESLLSFISEEFLPELYFIKEPSSYMLSGITQLCIDYLDNE